uniref:Uncharacterized protein n=1 Tax=Rhizophora mucronata TaxID=61149 RepID=A0A2P2IYY2_RHIMU
MNIIYMVMRNISPRDKALNFVCNKV